MEGMKKVLITVGGWVSENVTSIGDDNYRVEITSTEDCFFDVFDATIIVVEEVPDGSA
jgi:hypothetical protein